MAIISIFLLSISVLSPLLSHASLDPSPADFNTLLIADNDSRNTCNSSICTPLILIHGIHGNQQSGGTDDIVNPNRNYWLNLLNYIYGKGISDNYKIYRFHYVSDVHAVSDIGKALRNKIDDQTESGIFPNKKFVIVAHSMGGIVARSYMQEYQHFTGNYSGVWGGGRVIRLITLATPHHATPVANEIARDKLATDNSWRGLMDVIDVAYWKDFGLALAPTLPNRAALRWDNYDNIMTGSCILPETYPTYDCYDNPQEKNTWLINLNSSTSYDSKIIAYYGYIDPYNDLNNTDPNRSWLINEIDNQFFQSSKYGTLLGYACLDFSLSPDICTTPSGEHQQLLVVNILMSEGMNNYYLYNDGLVPADSGMFQGHSVYQRHQFIGYDHADMKDGRFEAGSFPLFDTIKTDLVSFHPEISYSPSSPDVLETVSFDGSKAAEMAVGSNLSYSWNFGDGNTGSGQYPTHVYRQTGNKTVSLTISDETGIPYPAITTSIQVNQRPINVSYPGGDSQSMSVDFSTPTSPYITNYRWDYGDSTLDAGATLSNIQHTFPTTGYYTITLILTLDDSSTIQSQTAIFVGPGTRYIPGHTIYGSETWLSGGIYEIQGNITVAQDANLTIASGVTVKLISSGKINVYGTLTATGVEFTKADGSSQWYGIRFDGSGASGSKLENCELDLKQARFSHKLFNASS